jgi:hypothetical protein
VPEPSADRYGSDVLAADSPMRTRTPAARPVSAQRGLVVEDVDTGWVGAIVRVEKAGGVHVVTLEDLAGRRRSFPLGAGFWIDGQPVILTKPTRGADATPAAPVQASRTASGSRAVHGQRAQVARGSRIWVEGKHDAELIEKVWGDDLRIEGVVVEMLDGVDNLADALARFEPTADRRVGVLVDHLVTGSKEHRLATAALQTVTPGTVMVLGHPYVDVWQAVRPARLGLATWPVIDRSIEWKRGICATLGWPADSQADIAQAWQRILATVRTYADLDPAFLGRVEELIDFVTA